MSLKLSETSIPPQNHKQSCWSKVYNKEENTCFQRSWKNIFLLLLYVLIFTLIILLVTFIMLTIAYHSMVSDSHPFYEIQGDGEIDPGLSFVPNINEHSPMIWYDRGSSKRKPEDYQEEIDKLLENYEDEPSGGSQPAEPKQLTQTSNDDDDDDDDDYNEEAEKEEDPQFVNCDKGGIKKLKVGEVCKFYKDSIGECLNDGYGYDSDNPCFFLKINKIPSWTPEYFSKKLPSSMPNSLKELIKKNQQKRMVWVSCDGRRPSDEDHAGTITYYPMQGFSGLHFPFKSVDDYISPLVAVKISNITKLYVVSLQCSIWAKNFRDNALSVQIFIDE